MSVAAPFRRTIEDIAENAGDIIIIVIGIVIFYALITIGKSLWGGVQSLLGGFGNLGGLLGGGGAAPPGGGGPYTTAGGSTITPPTGGGPGILSYDGSLYEILPGGGRAQQGQQAIRPGILATIFSQPSPVPGGYSGYVSGFQNQPAFVNLSPANFAAIYGAPPPPPVTPPPTFAGGQGNPLYGAGTTIATVTPIAGAPSTAATVTSINTPGSINPRNM